MFFVPNKVMYRVVHKSGERKSIILALVLEAGTVRCQGVSRDNKVVQ